MKLAIWACKLWKHTNPLPHPLISRPRASKKQNLKDLLGASAVSPSACVKTTQCASRPFNSGAAELPASHHRQKIRDGNVTVGVSAGDPLTRDKISDRWREQTSLRGRCGSRAKARHRNRLRFAASPG